MEIEKPIIITKNQKKYLFEMWSFLNDTYMFYEIYIFLPFVQNLYIPLHVVQNLYIPLHIVPNQYVPLHVVCNLYIPFHVVRNLYVPFHVVQNQFHTTLLGLGYIWLVV